LQRPTQNRRVSAAGPDTNNASVQWRPRLHGEGYRDPLTGPNVVAAGVATNQPSVNTDDDVVGLDERVRTLPFFQLQPFRRVGCDYGYYIDASGNPNGHFRADWAANQPGNRANKFVSGAELHVASCCPLLSCGP
jgi:hypothetical protein